MNTRNKYVINLENALYESLSSNNTPKAQKILTLLDTFPSANLSAVDENGQSLLHIALKNGAISSAEMLFDRLKDHSIVFHLDRDNCSPIWYAAAKGATKLLKQFIEVAKKREEDNEEHKPWLMPDIKNNSPLIKAIKTKTLATVALLLDEIENEVNAIEIIHHHNGNGKTALHIACRKKMFAIIALLFTKGAELEFKTDLGMPLTTLFEFSEEEQLAVFQCIKNETYQKKLLEIYRSHLANGTATKSAREFYFKKSGLLSFQALASAHLEFNPMIEARETYNAITARVAGQNNVTNKGKEKEEIAYTKHVYLNPFYHEKPIPDDILERAPRYAKKIGRCIEDSSSRSKNYIDIPSLANTNLKNTLYAAIKNLDIPTAEKLINFLKDEHDINLAAPYKNGENFLHIALKFGAMDLAHMLLELLKDDDGIFDCDDKNRSIIWYAAARGKTEFIKKVITLAKKQPQGNKAHKPLWLIADIEIYSPLMKAVESASDQTVALLLAEIANEKNALDLINQGNIEGDTALHIAGRLNIHDIVTLLFENGADLNVNNHKGDTPRIHLLRFPIEYREILKRKETNKIELNYLHVNRDRNTLTNLILDIQDYLTDLYNRSPISYPTRTAMVMLPLTFFIATFAEIFYCLINELEYNSASLRVGDNYRYNFLSMTVAERIEMKAEEQTLRNISDNYGSIRLTGACLIILFVGLGVLISCIPFLKRLIDKCWMTSPNINRHEYRSLCHRLQIDVQDKLQALEKQQMALPTNSDNLRNLELQVAALQHQQSLNQLKAILEQLKSILTTIRQDLNRSQIPLTMFTAATESKLVSSTEAEKIVEEDEARTIDGRTEDDIKRSVYS